MEIWVYNHYNDQREIINALKAEFVEGAVARDYDRKLAERVWADIEKFAEYAFNKSHAAAYGLLAYQTAYLKTHYPREYMAAVLNSYVGKIERVSPYIVECGRAGIRHALGDQEVLGPRQYISSAPLTMLVDAVLDERQQFRSVLHFVEDDGRGVQIEEPTRIREGGGTDIWRVERHVPVGSTEEVRQQGGLAGLPRSGHDEGRELADRVTQGRLE